MDSTVLQATIFAAMGSGMLARAIVHPLDTLKAKMQILRLKKTGDNIGIKRLISTTISEEGVKGLYRGYFTSVFGATLPFGLYMTSYEVFKNQLSFVRVDQLRFFMSGLFAEALACLLWVPIDIVKERLQVQANVKFYHYKGGADAITTILREEGLRGIYRGYGATLTYYGPWSAFYFSFYELYKKALLPGDSKQQSFAHSFFTAAAASISSSCIVNCIDVSKIRLQVQRASIAYANTDYNFQYRNVFHGLVSIVREEGVRALFKGFVPQACYVAMSSAISMSCTETFKAKLISRARNSE